MDEKKPKNENLFPFPVLRIETERLNAVFKGLKQGDIAECKTGDVRHAADLLAHVLLLEGVAPGLLTDVLSTLTPHHLRRAFREKRFEAEQKMADAAGAGDEYRAMVDAFKTGTQAEYIKAWIDAHMKANNWHQEEAVRAYAAQAGRDADSVRRTVTRQKARAKK